MNAEVPVVLDVATEGKFKISMSPQRSTSNFGVGVGFCVSERMMYQQNPTPNPTPTSIDVEFAKPRTDRNVWGHW
jgi:hypothetical protein